jgi:subtilisin family serine protease
MAAAHVAGVAAIYRSYYPSMTPFQVQTDILRSATSNMISGLDALSPNILLYSLIQLDHSIKGNIDGFVSTFTGGTLLGWACNYGIFTSIEVHVYYGNSAFEQGSFLKTGYANVASESVFLLLVTLQEFLIDSQFRFLLPKSTRLVAESCLFTESL